MAKPKSVDPSLWWDPFGSLLTELENASLSDDLPQPIADKLEKNHAWFVNTLSMFKSPSGKSKDALHSDVVKVNEHQLNLDEIQSYILVERSTKQEYRTTDSEAQPRMVMPLWKAKLEEPKQDQSNASVMIVDNSTSAGGREEEEDISLKEGVGFK
ncbi:unnamed protein product [Thlaspi arvense]|uniref:Uncharacterized protein n=1 Tax=Thlaspi arvense TaxID=13288 RepID=A0AAU9SNT9_THLAR|nr:unnamed protein product [Thlaspi arvense]